MYTINLYDHFFAQLNLYVYYCNFYIIIIKIIIKIYMYDVVNLYYLMSTNKSISYVLCNKGIIINLYKLHFSSFPFSLQLNKRIFHLPTFPPFRPNTQEGKPNIFYPFTFPSSHNFLSHSSYQTNSQGLKGILVKYHLIKRVRQIKQVLCDKY